MLFDRRQVMPEGRKTVGSEAPWLAVLPAGLHISSCDVIKLLKRSGEAELAPEKTHKALNRGKIPLTCPLLNDSVPQTPNNSPLSLPLRPGGRYPDLPDPRHDHREGPSAGFRALGTQPNRGAMLATLQRAA